MAGPGTQSAPKAADLTRLTLDQMKRVMHSMAMILLHRGERITLPDDVLSSHLDVVQSALAGATREELSHEPSPYQKVSPEIRD